MLFLNRGLIELGWWFNIIWWWFSEKIVSENLLEYFDLSLVEKLFLQGETKAFLIKSENFKTSYHLLIALHRSLVYFNPLLPNVSSQTLVFCFKRDQKGPLRSKGLRIYQVFFSFFSYSWHVVNKNSNKTAYYYYCAKIRKSTGKFWEFCFFTTVLTNLIYKKGEINVL